MNVHTTLLNQLEAFEAKFGVKVVPRSPTQSYVNGNPVGIEHWIMRDTDNKFMWCFGPLKEQMLDHDAHAHIEQAGLLAVLDSGYFLARSVNFAFMKDMAHAVMWYPTLADALDAALKQINKESK